MLPNGMSASFAAILAQSFSVFRRNILQILVVAAVIALFSSIIESSLVGAMARVTANLPVNTEQPLETGTGIIINEDGSSRDLQEDINQRSDSVIRQLREDQALQVFFILLPRILFTYVAMAILSFLAMIYFFILALQSDMKPDWGQVFDRLPPLLFPMMGLYIWIFIRSFTWIPILGIFTSIYYFPRFALSNVLLAEQRKGIRESARQSMRLSRGYWLTIFAHGVLVAIALGISLSILSVVAQTVGALTLSILGILFLNTFVNYLGIAVGTVYMTLLSKSILKEVMARKA